MKHEHRCHICTESYQCANGIDCIFQDQYAVCDKPECIAEWERPKREEWDEDARCPECGFIRCKCMDDGFSWEDVA